MALKALDRANSATTILLREWVISRNGRGHGTYMKEWCHIWMSHVTRWMSHVTRWMSHVTRWMSHVTRWMSHVVPFKESWHALPSEPYHSTSRAHSATTSSPYEVVMSPMKDLCHAYEHTNGVMSRWMSHVTHKTSHVTDMRELCHICERTPGVTLHTNESCHA